MGWPVSIFTDRFHDTRDEELMAEYNERHIPADTNGGWPFASGVILLAVVLGRVITVAGDLLFYAWGQLCKRRLVPKSVHS